MEGDQAPSNDHANHYGSIIMNKNKILMHVVTVAFNIMLVLIVLYAATALSSTAYDFGYRVFTEPAIDKEPGKDVNVSITSDLTTKDLGLILEDKGLVRDGNLFAVQMELSIYSMKPAKKKHQLIPGTYTLNTSMTAKEMLEVMSTEQAPAPENEEKTK